MMEGVVERILFIQQPMQFDLFLVFWWWLLGEPVIT